MVSDIPEYGDLGIPTFGDRFSTIRYTVEYWTLGAGTSFNQHISSASTDSTLHPHISGHSTIIAGAGGGSGPCHTGEHLIIDYNTSNAVVCQREAIMDPFCTGSNLFARAFPMFFKLHETSF